MYGVLFCLLLPAAELHFKSQAYDYVIKQVMAEYPVEEPAVRKALNT